MAHVPLEGILGQSPLFVQELARPPIQGRLEQPVVETVLQLLKREASVINGLMEIEENKISYN